MIIFLAALLLAGIGVAQERVSFPTEDGATIYADVYGKGDRGVVLVHGGRFTKESWKKQAQTLEAAGFRAIAIDLRGYGQSTWPGHSDPTSGPPHLDVLAAVRYLRATGAKTVSVIGGSMGGSAGADAAIACKPGEIQSLVILGTGAGDGPPEKIKVRKLLIIARDDDNGAGPRLPEVREQYARMKPPKKLIVLEGSAHAQFLFQTDQADRVMREILNFLQAH